MKPMSVEQCVSEGLSGLLKNRSRIVQGRLNRIMNALVPASLARKIEADILGKALARKPALQTHGLRPDKRAANGARGLMGSTHDCTVVVGLDYSCRPSKSVLVI